MLTDEHNILFSFKFSPRVSCVELVFSPAYTESSLLHSVFAMMQFRCKFAERQLIFPSNALMHISEVLCFYAVFACFSPILVFNSNVSNS